MIDEVSGQDTFEEFIIRMDEVSSSLYCSSASVYKSVNQSKLLTRPKQSAAVAATRTTRRVTDSEKVRPG